MNIRKEKETIGNQSVDRVFDIIEFLADYGKPIRLKEMSEELGINKSTLLRFLIALEKKGYVVQNHDTAMYRLGMKICTIAEKVRMSNKMGEIVQPYLNVLAEELGQAVFFMEEYDHMSVCVANSIGEKYLFFPGGGIGSISPLHCTSAGKIFLSYYSPEDLDSYIRTKGLAQYTENTIITRTELLSELDAVKTQGYALDDEEMTLGMKSISFPVFYFSGKIAGCITVMGLVNSLTNQFISENKDIMLKTVQDLSENMGNLYKM